MCCLTSVCWGTGCRMHTKFTYLQNTASILSRIRFSGPDLISPLPGPCLCAHRSTWLAMCDDTYTHNWRHLAMAWTIRKLKLMLSSVTVVKYVFICVHRSWHQCCKSSSQCSTLIFLNRKDTWVLISLNTKVPKYVTTEFRNLSS